MTLIKAVRNANMAIIKEGQRNPQLQGMGTTVTALLLTPYSALTAYVGIAGFTNSEKARRYLGPLTIRWFLKW